MSNQRISEETMLVAQLAASTSQGINGNLDPRDRKGYENLAARLNHRDIILGRNQANPQGMTRAEFLRQQSQQFPQQYPQNYPQPPQHYPISNPNVNMPNGEPLIQSDVDRFQLPSVPSGFIPMVNGPQENFNADSGAFPPPNSSNEFVVPDFLGGTPKPKQNTNTSSVVISHLSEQLDTAMEMLADAIKKINRMEKKINELHKHANIIKPAKNTTND